MQASRMRQRRKPTARRPSRTKSTTRQRKRPTSAAAVTKAPESKRQGIGKFLSAQNLQESLKSVGNLRSMVKNWLTYLQQADQLLDTVYTTSNSLRESGVLEKLVKHKGKNMSTEDFTNILIALMNSPVGSQFLKSMGGGGEDTSEKSDGDVTTAQKTE